MNYCEVCGSKLVEASNNHFHCDACGGDFYVNPRGATALLLTNDQGELVLGRRAHDPSKGKLDCLGGFLDVGESFEEGMLRELTEESGLQPSDISELCYLGSVYDPYPWQGRVVHTTSVYFTAKLKEGRELRPADDIASIEALPIDSVRREDVAWEGMWKMIEKLKAGA